MLQNLVAPWCGGGASDHGNDAQFWQHLVSNDNIVCVIINKVTSNSLLISV